MRNRQNLYVAQNRRDARSERKNFISRAVNFFARSNSLRVGDFREKIFNYICVCSNETVSKKTEEEILKVNLPVPATTNPDEISRRLENFSDNMTVIFSTYQSLERVAETKIEFDLIICDEAHRTTGYGKDATKIIWIFDTVQDKNR